MPPAEIAVGLTKFLFWNAASDLGYISFETFWGHFWTGFDNKARAINLNVWTHRKTGELKEK